MPLYIAFNGAPPSTAAQVPVATGVAIKTLLQIATPSTREIEVVEWGISFNGSVAATPIKCELLEASVAATAGASLSPTTYRPSNAPGSLCIGGTALTCYSPGAEGTVTTVRMFDAQFISPLNGYIKQFPLGNEPVVAISHFLRIRVTAATTVDAYCYVIWRE